MHQMETQGLTVHSGLLFCYFRYIPRERFLDPLARPVLSICTWILQKVSQLNLTRGRSARLRKCLNLT